MFARVLIANRGEIAIRIAKGAASLGVESVAVHSTVDALSLHTRFATQARELDRNADPVRAYLDVETLLRIARETGCDCVHPGYGFLAENARFAHRCHDEGFAFIGPSSDALALFGDKVRARELARAHGIPVIPGSTAALASPSDAAKIAAEIGYPVMLKAAAGGGGRGMRAVASESELAEAYARCRSEAEAAFGDGTLFVEKLVERPRHVEVQVLADNFGATTHLFTRDCSVQLRNQKVVEIAPAPNLDAELREKLHADAVALAKAGGCVNAATVEFLVSPERGEHWFIECNPRIQVEHTVTEQITGIDLVEAQFAIASGATLSSLGFGEHGPREPRGFAVQARVVTRGAGTFTGYREPSGVGVRVDACGYLGWAPPPQFDPLFAKVIGASNSSGSYASALDRTVHALEEFHVTGVPTNIAQLRAILTHPEVRAGDARTSLLSDGAALAHVGSVKNGGALGLFEQQSGAVRPGAVASVPIARAADLHVDEGQVAVDCPISGSVVDVRIREGDTVAAGEVLLVVTAMKMETEIPPFRT